MFPSGAVLSTTKRRPAFQQKVTLAHRNNSVLMPSLLCEGMSRLPVIHLHGGDTNRTLRPAGSLVGRFACCSAFSEILTLSAEVGYASC